MAIYSGTIPSTTFIENLIEGLSAKGFEIYLFGKIARKVNYTKNVKIHSTPDSDILLLFFVLKEFITLLSKSPKLFKLSIQKIWNRRKKFKQFFKEAGVILPIINNQPQILHIQWAKVINKYPELFELLNCKFVLSLRGAHINYSPIADDRLAESYKKYFPMIDGFHAVSEAIAKEGMKYGADDSKIKVIYSSVKEELFKSNIKLYKTDQTLEIVSIGRFHWKKGYNYALDAMKQLNNENINFTYTIIAQDEISEEILFMVKEYNLEKKVTILSGLSYDDLINKLGKSNILLLPSVEEGIANVVLEAMAAGVFIITTNCGGMNEVIKDNYNGYIVAVRDPEMIVNKIKQFISLSSESQKSILENSKLTIKNKFNRERQIDSFSGLYSSLLH